MHAYIHTYIHACIHTHNIHAHIYTAIHTHTQLHTHTAHILLHTLQPVHHMCLTSIYVSTRHVPCPSHPPPPFHYVAQLPHGDPTYRGADALPSTHLPADGGWVEERTGVFVWEGMSGSACCPVIFIDNVACY